jgi:redox-sensitive bicupin YhaK (pirin superfamily)
MLLDRGGWKRGRFRGDDHDLIQLSRSRASLASERPGSGDGFQVRRALPSAQRRMVGPFIFLDSFGPVTFRAGEGLDSRPHPHIGLSTLTYLIDGEIVHRDSEGYVSRRSAQVRSI